MTPSVPLNDASGGWNAVAAEFISRPSPLVDVSVVQKWGDSIRSGGSILDLGCGHGFPISAALAKCGFSIHGVDASGELVLESRRRIPHAKVQCEAVETSDFFDRRFEAATWTDILTGRPSRSLGSEACELLLEGAGFYLEGGFTDEGESQFYGARKLVHAPAWQRHAAHREA